MRLTPRRFLAILAAVPALGLAAASTAQAAPTLTQPAASTTYRGDVIAVDYTLDAAPQNDIRLEFTYTSGSGATAGDTWTVLLAGVVSTQSFTMRAADPTLTSPASKVASVTPSAGASGTALPDGTYDVTLKYTDSMSHTARASATAHGMVIDSVTRTPAITSPVSGSASSSPLSVGYTLPETASAGSARLTFMSPTRTRVITLAAGASTAGAHAISLPGADLASSPDVASVLSVPTGLTTLPDDVYSVTLSYQDAVGNGAAASAAVGSLTIDTQTLTPVLGAPAAGISTASTLPVSYTLPEQGLAGSVTLTLTSGSASHVLTLAGATPGAHGLTLDRADLAGSTGVQAVTGGATLPDGTYSATLAYRDALANPFATVAAAGIELRTPALSAVPMPADTGTALPAAVPDPSAADPGPPAAPVTLLSPGPASLAVTWSVRPAPHANRRARATFAPVAGAARYRLVATRGRSTRTGTCAPTRRRGRRFVACTMTLTPGLPWTLRASALDAKGVVVATTATRVSVPRRAR